MERDKEGEEIQNIKEELLKKFDNIPKWLDDLLDSSWYKLQRAEFKARIRDTLMGASGEGVFVGDVQISPEELSQEYFIKFLSQNEPPTGSTTSS